MQRRSGENRPKVVSDDKVPGPGGESSKQLSKAPDSGRFVGPVACCRCNAERAHRIHADGAARLSLAWQVPVTRCDLFVGLGCGRKSECTFTAQGSLAHHSFEIGRDRCSCLFPDRVCAPSSWTSLALVPSNRNCPRHHWAYPFREPAEKRRQSWEILPGLPHQCSAVPYRGYFRLPRHPQLSQTPQLVTNSFAATPSSPPSASASRQDDRPAQVISICAGRGRTGEVRRRGWYRAGRRGSRATRPTRTPNTPNARSPIPTSKFSAAVKGICKKRMSFDTSVLSSEVLARFVPEPSMVATASSTGVLLSASSFFSSPCSET